MADAGGKREFGDAEMLGNNRKWERQLHGMEARVIYILKKLKQGW